MKRLFAVAVFGALALAPAVVDAHGKGHGGNPEERRAMMVERFEKADADKNGTVTRAEMYEYMRSRAREMDLNKDGVIDAEEFDAGTKAKRMKKHARKLGMMDTDGDGSVSTEEFSRSGPGKMLYRVGNRDGELTREELEDMMQRPRHHGGPRHGMGHGGRSNCPMQ